MRDARPLKVDELARSKTALGNMVRARTDVLHQYQKHRKMRLFQLKTVLELSRFIAHRFSADPQANRKLTVEVYDEHGKVGAETHPAVLKKQPESIQLPPPKPLPLPRPPPMVFVGKKRQLPPPTPAHRPPPVVEDATKYTRQSPARAPATATAAPPAAAPGAAQNGAPAAPTSAPPAAKK